VEDNLKKVKTDEDSISRIFINDLKRERSKVTRKFYARARSLGDKKAISRDIQHWLEYQVHPK
jgi:hypothetical protein